MSLASKFARFQRIENKVSKPSPSSNSGRQTSNPDQTTVPRGLKSSRHHRPRSSESSLGIRPVPARSPSRSPRSPARSLSPGQSAAQNSAHGPDEDTEMGDAPSTVRASDTQPGPAADQFVGPSHGDLSDDAAVPSGQDDEAIPYSVWEGSLMQGRLQITTLLVKARNKQLDKGPKVDEKDLKRRQRSVRAFLFYLEHEIGASPQLKAAKIDSALAILKNPDNAGYFPQDIKHKGAELFERFEAENWGQDVEPTAVGDEDSEGDLSPGPPSPLSAAPVATNEADNTTSILLPPPNHQIWGLQGIMHGLAFKVNPVTRKRTYVMDPRYVHKKKNFRVIGANGLQPGDWWPFQRVALFHGAHGHSMSGISGTPDSGAYSIVLSGGGIYEGMDVDEGETIYYSADQSADNTDRTRVVAISNRTKSLQTSLRTGNPVRVLRGASKNGAFAPAVGIRYDGLYTVVKQEEKTNSKGGKFLRFELRRRGGQRPFQQTVMAAPTVQQQQQYERIRSGYS